VNFTLYSEKAATECIKALTERLHQSETPTRPALDGFVHKNGKFRIGVELGVFRQITRKTWVEGQIIKEGALTLIRGQVPEGATPGRQRFIGFLIPIAGGIMALRGELLLGLLAMVLIGYVLITVRGDYYNSDRLLMELEKNLKASPKPPKSMTGAGKATGAKKA